MNDYGYLNTEWQTELDQYKIKKAVWVNASVLLKNLNGEETYIYFSDRPRTYKTVSKYMDIEYAENKKINFFIFIILLTMILISTV
jgi:hypothetical protein